MKIPFLSRLLEIKEEQIKLEHLKLRKMDRTIEIIKRIEQRLYK